MSDGYVKEGSYQDILSDGKRTLRIWQEGRTESGTPTLTPIDVAPVVNWQPIETAPKDGTRVLLYSDGECEVSSYVPQFTEREEDAGKGLYRKVMVETGYWSCEYACAPTHWQPLPPAPEG